MPTREDLKWLQSLSWQQKVLKTQVRILEWFNRFDGQVYLSFSGGKDSTVLAHIISEMGLEIEKVFADTGLEYPEIRAFVKDSGATIIRPKMRFDEVIRKYGYPVISKEVSQAVYEGRRSLALGKTDTLKLRKLRGEMPPLDNGQPSRFNHEKYEPLLRVDFIIGNACCNVMKKAPFHTFERETGKKPIVATMTEESALRKQQWLKNGCNAFDTKRARSAPMSFWTEQDVLAYIQAFNLPIASVYGEVVESGCKLCTTGAKRTGCVYCAFGAHRRGDDRFLRLKETHPRQYEYCLEGGGYDTDGLWKPTKEGLGMRHVFENLNEIYGENFIKY